MNKPKHTPWKQSEDDFCIYVENARGQIVAEVRTTEHYPDISPGMEAMREVARLLAAAPEMLEEIRGMAALIEVNLPLYPKGTDKYLAKVRAVVAKAEGQHAVNVRGDIT